MRAGDQTYSRYQVLCAEREAWTDDAAAGRETYFYDGISFWRRDASGGERVVPSWQAPRHGWRHTAECACDLCASRRPAVRPRSVA